MLTESQYNDIIKKSTYNFVFNAFKVINCILFWYIPQTNGEVPFTLQILRMTHYSDCEFNPKIRRLHFTEIGDYKNIHKTPTENK